MSRFLRLQAEKAFDSKSYNNLNTTSNYSLTSGTAFTVPEHLVLVLTNREGYTEFEGLFNFTGTIGTALTAALPVTTEIKVYNSSSLVVGNLVYDEKIINTLPIGTVGALAWSVPVQFGEDPTLAMCEDTVVYYVTVTVTTTGTIAPVLQQYSFLGYEVADVVSIIPPIA